MPRVPDELKERLKREVSVQRLAEARGIKLPGASPVYFLVHRVRATLSVAALLQGC